MGIRDSLKKKVIGLVDKEQRDINREEKLRERNNREVDRYERENTLKAENMQERQERRKMLKGEEPLSVRKYVSSRAKEAKNNAKISAGRTFNRDHIKDSAVSGLKGVGSGIVKTGSYAGTRLAEASVQSYGGPTKKSSGKKHRAPSLAEELGFVTPQEPRRSSSGKRQRQRQQQQRDNDNYSFFGGSDARSMYGQDFSGVFGHSSSGFRKKKGKKQSSNPFDFDIDFGF